MKGLVKQRIFLEPGSQFQPCHFNDALPRDTVRILMKAGGRKSVPQNHCNPLPALHEKSRGPSIVEDRPAVGDRVAGKQDQNQQNRPARRTHRLGLLVLEQLILQGIDQGVV